MKEIFKINNLPYNILAVMGYSVTSNVNYKISQFTSDIKLTLFYPEGYKRVKSNTTPHQRKRTRRDQD